MQSEFPFPDKVWCCCLAMLFTMTRLGVLVHFQNRTQLIILLYCRSRLIISSIFTQESRSILTISKKCLCLYTFSQRTSVILMDDTTIFLAHFKPLWSVPLVQYMYSHGYSRHHPALIYMASVFHLSWAVNLATILITDKSFEFDFKAEISNICRYQWGVSAFLCLRSF